MFLIVPTSQVAHGHFCRRQREALPFTTPQCLIRGTVASLCAPVGVERHEYNLRGRRRRRRKNRRLFTMQLLFQIIPMSL